MEEGTTPQPKWHSSENPEPCREEVTMEPMWKQRSATIFPWGGIVEEGHPFPQVPLTSLETVRTGKLPRRSAEHATE
jgi:hypothetical protein